MHIHFGWDTQSASCLYLVSNFSMICFLYLFAGLILITHISGLFLSLLRMVLSGVLSLNCTKLSHFQLVNYIFFLQFQSSPCAIWRSWSLVCVVFIFIIYLQMYQSYLLLYYFSVILYYEFPISMWTSWYSKTNILSTYFFVFILCFIWELRLFVISTKFSNNFIFINLHDINKSNFVVVVKYWYRQLCFVSCHQ